MSVLNMATPKIEGICGIKKMIHTLLDMQSEINYYYSSLSLNGIGEYRKGSSSSISLAVHPFSRPCSFFHDGWMDFLHIGYEGTMGH